MLGYVLLFLFLLTLLMGPAIFAVLSVYYTLYVIRRNNIHREIAYYAQSVYYRAV
jgi:hypothetical protein